MSLKLFLGSHVSLILARAVQPSSRTLILHQDRYRLPSSLFDRRGARQRDTIHAGRIHDQLLRAYELRRTCRTSRALVHRHGLRLALKRGSCTVT